MDVRFGKMIFWVLCRQDLRRLESLESEHRPDSLLYPAMILLDTLFRYLQDRTRTRRGSVPTSFSLATARCEAA